MGKAKVDHTAEDKMGEDDGFKDPELGGFGDVDDLFADTRNNWARRRSSSTEEVVVKARPPPVTAAVGKYEKDPSVQKKTKDRDEEPGGWW
ncbi:hypothetical protein BV898_19363 [Hypsibius exemplaris]|uniref:Uncharacterized protein n=1 Tax=Hypsibius exemplaris TaxID=2072580 RepID=A0A9X6NLI9_HYPEX|nr:hypothetical protein BV898_19363 [Hypsibius exemplaris]